MVFSSFLFICSRCYWTKNQLLITKSPLVTYILLGGKMNENIFERVEKKTNVKKEDILKLAKRISGQDLSNDENLRSLIKDVAKLAGKDVSKEKEEKIINAVKKDKIPHQMSDLL